MPIKSRTVTVLSIITVILTAYFTKSYALTILSLLYTIPLVLRPFGIVIQFRSVATSEGLLALLIIIVRTVFFRASGFLVGVITYILCRGIYYLLYLNEEKNYVLVVEETD